MPWTCTSTSSHNYCRHWHHFSNCCERLRRDDPKKGPVAAHLAFLMGSEQAAKMISFSPPSNAGEALTPFLVIVGFE